MKRPDPKKVIGLIRRIADGLYEPTNDRSRAKLDRILLYNPMSNFLFDENELPMLRKIASKKGYFIMTTNRMVRS